MSTLSSEKNAKFFVLNYLLFFHIKHEFSVENTFHINFNFMRAELYIFIFIEHLTVAVH